MGALFFETEEKGFQIVMDQFREKLEAAGTGIDGETEVEIVIRGKSTQTLKFKTKGTDELIEILKLNTD
ncbi:hypothetical protein [Bradyrhizobium sp. 63_E2_N1_3]|uniref:hypothetical protein n=1 Tax=Bradyrhizobium sp. 63_E2_N1_3 TaxID=3240373 RepID=UPI003F8C03DA